MTAQRKAEVNQRLAEFYEKATHYYEVAVTVDFTADLNALARLEAKLPPHSWHIDYLQSLNEVAATLRVRGEDGKYRDSQGFVLPTESEARAETICQYLEQRDEEKVSAR